MKDNIEKGKFLKSLREAHNLTQDELAQKIGVSQSDVLVWETGIKFPDDEDTLNKLASTLDVTVDELNKGHFIDDSDNDENSDGKISEDNTTGNKDKLKVTEAHGKYKKNDRVLSEKSENILIVVLAILIAIIALITAFTGKTASNASYKYLYFDSDSFINNQSYIKVEDNIDYLYLYEIDTSSDKKIDNITLYYNDITIVNGENKDYIIEDDENENVKNMLNNDTFIKVTYTDGSSEVSKITFSSDYNYSITDKSKIINPNKTTNKQKIIYNDDNKNKSINGEVDPSILLNYGFSYTSNKYVKSTKGIRVEYYDGVIHLYVKDKEKSVYVERTVGSSRYEYTYTDRNGSTKITSEDIKESKDCEKEDCTITRNYVAYTKYISNILVNNRK